MNSKLLQNYWWNCRLFFGLCEEMEMGFFLEQNHWRRSGSGAVSVISYPTVGWKISMTLSSQFVSNQTWITFLGVSLSTACSRTSCEQAVRRNALITFLLRVSLTWPRSPCRNSTKHFSLENRHDVSHGSSHKKSIFTFSNEPTLLIETHRLVHLEWY